MLGERYGWTPQPVDFPDAPEFDWLKEYKPAGASITELEIALATASGRAIDHRTFFYLRDSNFQR